MGIYFRHILLVKKKNLGMPIIVVLEKNFYFIMWY